MDNKKNLIILAVIVAVIIIGAIGGYFYLEKLKNYQQVQQITTTQTQQNPLPDFGVQTAPLQNVPDINPTTQTNPYKAVKTNPFE